MENGINFVRHILSHHQFSLVFVISKEHKARMTSKGQSRVDFLFKRMYQGDMLIAHLIWQSKTCSCLQLFSFCWLFVHTLYYQLPGSWCSWNWKVFYRNVPWNRMEGLQEGFPGTRFVVLLPYFRIFTFPKYIVSFPFGERKFIHLCTLIYS